MAVHTLGECPRVGCDKTILLIEELGRAVVPNHDCKGKPYTTKPREYTDGH